MSYQAVVFDLFGTLVPNFSVAAYDQFVAEMAATLGIPLAAFAPLWGAGTWEMRATGVFKSPAENVAFICRTLHIEADPDRVATAARIRFEFSRAALVPRAGAVEALGALRASGVRLALISDCSSEVPVLWPQTPLASLIEIPIFSCAEGMKKPDPRIYQLACARLGVAPAQCLYVGDGSSGELTGAARVGMSPVLFRTPLDDTYDAHRIDVDAWDGPAIAALDDVLALAGISGS